MNEGKGIGCCNGKTGSRRAREAGKCCAGEDEAQGIGCARPVGRNKGFAFSAEAALSFLILISSAAFLSLFSIPSSGEEEFMLCTDAAGVLAKSGAFQSQAALSSAVEEASRLSGLCISAGAGSEFASSCGGVNPANRLSFSFPALTGEGVEKVAVSCWKGDPTN